MVLSLVSEEIIFFLMLLVGNLLSVIQLAKNPLFEQSLIRICSFSNVHDQIKPLLIMNSIFLPAQPNISPLPKLE